MKIFRARRNQITAFILLAFLLSASWSVGYADHDPDHEPIIVDTTEDGTNSDGLCTLREAVISANKDNDSTGDCESGDGDDIIVLLANENHILSKDDNGNEDSSSSGDLDFTDSVTIIGSNSTISGRNGFKNRIIHVLSGVVRIQNVTISGGSPKRDGGAIFNEAVLHLTDVTVAQNDTDGNGGAIHNANSGARLELERVTINDNLSGGDGGGIFNLGILDARNITISGNDANNDGGGLFDAGGTVTLNNVTVFSNNANADGRQGGAGGGFARASGAVGSVTISNTIISGNGNDDCSGPIPSAGYNLAGPSCGFGNPGDITASDPGLNPVLAPNRGITFTHALIGGSSAIDGGDDDDPTTCEGIDQRGHSRTDDLACDIGAYEADPPIAADDIGIYFTDEDTPLLVDAPGVLWNDSDADGDPLTAVLVTAPSAVDFTLNGDGSFDYTPNPGFHGTDTFTYVANDGSADSNVATVTITVISVNDPPVAVDDTYSTNEDEPLSVAAPGVLGEPGLPGEDTDPDGDLLTAVLVSSPSAVNFTFNGDGSFDYTPDANFNGTDSFTYVANDGSADSNIATVTITVIAVNDPPVAADDAYSTNEDEPLNVAAPGVLGEPGFPGEDTDPDGDPLTAILVAGPLAFDFSFKGDGSFDYTPDADFNGTDSFTYKANDVTVDSNIATVTIEVFAVNDPPTATDDEYSTDEDQVLTIAAPGVLINDSDIDGGLLKASVVGGNKTANGTVNLNLNGSFTYDPNADFYGTDSFTYEVDDSLGGIDTAIATITVNPIDDAPIAPSLIRVLGVEEGTSGSTVINGLVPDFPLATFTLNVYSWTTCSNILNDGALQTIEITTDEDGYFIATLADDPEIGTFSITLGDFVVATVSAGGDTSPESPCTVASFGNFSWPTALELTGTEVNNQMEINHEQYIDTFGQSLWFKFSAQPGSQLIVTLTNLAANYDLTVYKDIGAAYNDLTSTADLQRLSAEFAPSAFSPSAFSPSAFSPSAFSPSAFSPSAFSPSAFSPSAFSPSAFSPSAFSPSAFSPSAFSPSAFSPSAFSPDAWSPSAFSPSAFSPSAFSPSAFSPSAFSPSAFSPSAFSAAQLQALIGVSAFDGTAGEGLVLNSWNNTGDFYVRVRGREGAFSLDAPFTLGIVVQPGTCGSVSEASLPPTNIGRQSGSFKTVILTDMDRMEGTAEEKADLMARLTNLAARPEVQGVIVDVSEDARVQAANNQANSNLACPFAKNLAADAIRRIVDQYRSTDLDYVVIVGGDGVIPFFRHPDQAWLGPESQYVPPVLDSSASQASLRLNFVLSQDDYGANFSVSSGIDEIPIPDLAVGRLVETALEATNMVDVYLQTTGGVVPTPTSSLVTAYDFLQDAGDAIQDEFEASLGVGSHTEELIAPNNISPEDPASWTATQLAEAFLDGDHDLIFLAGHFSAASALAADYRTSLTTLDMLGSSVDLTNSIVFSAGCHSGYNIVNDDGVPFVTFEPDWAQAFAQKGATFIGGTGYQYGDTDFLEYSERIYLEFARQLRSPGTVSVGDALVASKQDYLAKTPQLRGIHTKALLEATLFGLPMLSVDMPGPAYEPQGLTPAISNTTGFQTDPGLELGLQYADLTVNANLMDHVLDLTNYDDGSSVQAFWLSGSNGVVTNPSEPTLPLELRNITHGSGVVRGVGFRGGSYEDLQNVLPLTGAPTTEIRGVHTPFVTSVLYPVRPWGVNYFDTLASGGAGTTQLVVTPAQFRSAANDAERGTLRKFNNMIFRLYYSSFTQTDDASGQSALAAPPTIVSVSSVVNGSDILFSVPVVDNPAAGIQEVWVTYTDISNPGTWSSVDLQQSETDTTLWEGALLDVSNPGSIRYIVQATNGLGLVSMATNLGNYYIPGAEAGQGKATSIALASDTPSSGKYGTQVGVSAKLTDAGGAPLGGKLVSFFLGSIGRVSLTDGSGTASASLPVFALPGEGGTSGENEIAVVFAGDAEYAQSSNSSQFSIQKRDTLITMVDLGESGGFSVEQVLIEATLTEANPGGRTLPEQTIIFNVTGNGLFYYKAVITDYQGRAQLGEIPLPPGDYSVDAFFSGSSHGHAFSHVDERYNPSSASFAVFTLNNTKPDGLPDSYSVDEDSVLTKSGTEGVLANDTDVDDQSLTAVLSNDALNGAVTLNSDGSFTYTPNADFFGSDSFGYFANDGIDNSDAVTVAITVSAVNDPPVAIEDDYTTNEDEPFSANVLANDTDVDNASLTASLVTDVTNGALTLNGDGSFSYTPAANFNGSDSFSYKANDGSADSNAVTVTITVSPVNDSPVAGDDSYSTNEDETLIAGAPGVLGDDTDVDGDSLSALLVSGVSDGTMTLNADGSFTYVPNPDFNGTDSFTYKANDGGLDSNVATVTINVISINDPPDCSTVAPSIVTLWPVDGKMDSITISGATDPDGDNANIAYVVTAVFQDEPVGRQADAQLFNDSDTVRVRAERDGSGDGRVYHIFYTATDEGGATCSGIVRVATVPHDQGSQEEIDEIDGGPLHDSTIPDR